MCGCMLCHDLMLTYSLQCVSLQMISRLQQQVKDLKDELQLATGEARTDELSDEEKATLVMLDNVIDAL